MKFWDVSTRVHQMMCCLFFEKITKLYDVVHKVLLKTTMNVKVVLIQAFMSQKSIISMPVAVYHVTENAQKRILTCQ